MGATADCVRGIGGDDLRFAHKFAIDRFAIALAVDLSESVGGMTRCGVFGRYD